MEKLQKNDFLKIENHPWLSERGVAVCSFLCVDSTNTLARTLVSSGELAVPALVLSDSQRGGRGRMGRSFYSPEGTGIYMTLVLDITEESLASAVKITTAASVAVSRAILSVTGKNVGIKWVNDLYLNNKKICGILAESFFTDGRRYAAVGVGINLSTYVFPSELEGIAGSIGEDGEVRRELTASVCREIYDIYEDIKQGDTRYMEEYRSRSTVLGKQVDFVIDGIKYSGEALSVDDSGGLLVQSDDGEQRVLCSGEISLRIKEV